MPSAGSFHGLAPQIDILHEDWHPVDCNMSRKVDIPRAGVSADVSYCLVSPKCPNQNELDLPDEVNPTILPRHIDLEVPVWDASPYCSPKIYRQTHYGSIDLWNITRPAITRFIAETVVNRL